MTYRMDPRAEGSTIHRLPETFLNKRGEAILVRTLDDRICEGLVKMYLDFQPRNSFQGLPPVSDKVCVAWVKQMIASGINLAALSFDVGVVGHVVLFPIDDLRCELLIAVLHSYQNTGIGTQLMRCCVQLACEIGFEKIWLPVQASNARARHLYRKCGFDYIESKDAQELEMAMDVKRYHEAISIGVERIMNTKLVTIGPTESCRKAVELILSRRISSLPVIDEHGVMMGVLAENDLMLPSNLTKQVADILTRDVLTVRANCTIARVVRMFQSSKVGSIPVLDERNQLVGLIGRKDILAYYVACL